MEQNGWSNLCILAHEDSWFRDPSIYGYFDRLVDDGFFEDFDKVVFFGADTCGYAACAYSVVAPGATVIAVAPQATLDMARVGWDRRFPQMRRTDFTSRYAYAPDMVEGAEAVYLLLDPANTEDAMHASLFHGDNIHRLNCRHLGDFLSGELWSMGILPGLILEAGHNRLTPLSACQSLRKRRGHLPTCVCCLINCNRLADPNWWRHCHAMSRNGAAHHVFARRLVEAERELEDA